MTDAELRRRIGELYAKQCRIGVDDLDEQDRENCREWYRLVVEVMNGA